MAERNREGLPPPTGKGRRGPEMMEEDPSIYGKLSQLASQEPPEVGGEGGAGGGDVQQLLMSGASQLMQAAKLHPALQEVVTQAISLLRQGIEGLAGGAETEVGGGEMRDGGMMQQKGRERIGPPTGKYRKKKTTVEEDLADGE